MRMKERQTILGGCLNQCMLYLVYAVLGVCCTRCMLYSVYAVLGVCCNQCMLYSVNAVLGVCCCKGIRPCMASYEGISVDTVANVDVNIVE